MTASIATKDTAQQAQWRKAFEDSQVIARKLEGWKSEENIRRLYLSIRKDGYYQDLTTYQRWEGFFAATQTQAFE